NNPGIPADEVLRLIDIEYELVNEAHGGGYGRRINFVYSDDSCGAMAFSNESRITICSGFNPRNLDGRNYPWHVFAHEMSHVMAGNLYPYWLSLAQNGYSAFWDEHQAEVVPEYVYRTMIGRQTQYGLTPEEVSSLGTVNAWNRATMSGAAGYGR